MENKILNWWEMESKYPKSIKVLKQYLLDNVFKAVAHLEKEEVEEMFIMTLAPQLDSRHRMLYDFFDEQKMYIVIDCMDYIEGKEWIPMVVNTELESKPYRMEAENLAFLEAFNLLEQELNKENE